AARTSASSGLELHFGGRRRVRRRLEERLLLEAADPRHERAGEEADARVVVADRLVVLAALLGDPVLGALELRLERKEILIRLEVRVALDGHEEPTQRARQLTLSRLEALERLRIVERLRRQLDGRCARARLGDLLQHRALLRREAFDGLDEVRDEVGAALVDV